MNASTAMPSRAMPTAYSLAWVDFTNTGTADMVSTAITPVSMSFAWGMDSRAWLAEVWGDR